MDYAAESDRHRCMAEEYRTMADTTLHEVLRPHYILLAEIYEQLAASEMQVARNLKIIN